MRPNTLTQEEAAARYERLRADQRAYLQRPDVKERHRAYQRARYAEMRAAWLALKGGTDASS